jgi:hypothetical protein
MPAPANLSKRDFYVYQFKVDGYPFYVGIGRYNRGDERLRYVRSLNAAKRAMQRFSFLSFLRKQGYLLT